MSELTGDDRRSRWPTPSFRHVPGGTAAAQLAERVRRVCLGREDVWAPLRDLGRLAEAGGLGLREAQLSAERGMQEGMLIPLANDRFAVTVDPTPRGGWQRFPLALRTELSRHRARFRTAHEIGHTFFYERGAGEPRRALRDSVAQEDFCDAFARALLLPPAAVAELEPSPASILDLHRGYDVSVELAARSMAHAHSEVEVSLWFWCAELSQMRLQWSSLRGGVTEYSPASSTEVPAGASVEAHLLPPPRRQLLIVRRLGPRADGHGRSAPQPDC